MTLELQIISGKFQNNAINDVKQISLSHVINLVIYSIYVRVRINIFKIRIYIYLAAKKISFYYFREIKLCPTHQKTHANSIYIIEIKIVSYMDGV